MSFSNYTASQVADKCTEYGAQLVGLPAGVTGPQLLWAMSGNESRFGSNCTPRHESAYDFGGKYQFGNLDNLHKYGSPAAYSYGPWQIMFCNASAYTPDSLALFISVAALATTSYLNKQIAHFKPTTLAQIGSIWNGGNPSAILEEAAVQQYAAELEKNYATTFGQIPGVG
jgi:hypothetical protein